MAFIGCSLFLQGATEYIQTEKNSLKKEGIKTKDKVGVIGWDLGMSLGASRQYGDLGALHQIFFSKYDIHIILYILVLFDIY